MIQTLQMLTPLAWRNLGRNPRRTVITLLVVSVGLFSILTFSAFIEAWASSGRDRALNLLTGSGQIHAPGYLEDPTISNVFPFVTGPLLDKLNGDDFAGWAPRLNINAVVQSEYRTMPLTIIGVDPVAERNISIIPGSVTAGEYLRSSDDPTIVLGQRLVDRLKTRLGKRVILLAQGADGSLFEQSFEVSGIYDNQLEIEDRFAFVGLTSAQEMLGTGNALAEIAFRVADRDALGQTIDALGELAPELDIRSWRELSPMAAAIDETSKISTLIWLWVMFSLMSFGIVNTQLMAVYERVREFGLLQALGMQPRMILIIVTLESAILVGFGVLIGLALAILAILSLSNGIDISYFAEAAAMVGSGTVLYPILDISRLIEFSLVIWGLGVAVTLWPARKAAKSSPVEAMAHVS